MSRHAAGDRLRQLLAIVPWLVDHPGAPVEEICARFGIGESELLQALETLQFVGVHPFTPDALVDVVVEDGRVWLYLAEPFGRPLRLSPQEGLALVAAGRSAVSTPGFDPDGSLARGLSKLAGSLGITDEDVVEVRLGDEVEPQLLGRLRDAAADHRRVVIDYYSFARDEHTRREIEPHRVFADQGRWYVAAHCHSAGGDRVFRVDRIEGAEVLDASFEPPSGAAEGTSLDFAPGPDAPRVVLELEPAARWVVEHHPCEAVDDLGDGRVRATLAVTARPWLERLLLGLGPDARVVAVDERLGGVDVGRRAAARLLERYGIDPDPR